MHVEPSTHVTTTVETLQHLLAELMQCVNSLHSTYGDTAAMRRVINDANGIRTGIDRLQIDAEDLRLTSAAIPKSTEMIQISDADYDVAFWRDVDHEGVGSQSLACALAPRNRR